MTRTLPPEALKRLKRAEQRQRRETKDRNLKAEAVSVEGLWLLQQGQCGCGCGHDLDVESKWDEAKPPHGYPVIAHVLARGSRGEHTIDNVRLWRWHCNWKRSQTEKGEIASVKRHTPKKQFSLLSGRDAGANPKSKRPKGRKIPQPNVSPLSSDHPSYRKPKFQKRGSVAQ